MNEVLLTIRLMCYAINGLVMIVIEGADALIKLSTN